MSRYTCHAIMHDGEGPLCNPSQIDAESPDAAAEIMALKLWRVEGEDDMQEDGDYQWVAVLIPHSTDLYKVFKVKCKVVRQFLTVPVGTMFSREQIEQSEVHKQTNYSMALTAEEKPKVIQWLREYPRGQPKDAWGLGELASPAPPFGEDPSICMEYG